MQKSPSPPPKAAKGPNSSVLTGSPKKDDPKAVNKKEEAAKKEEDEKRAAEVAKLQKKEETSEERFMKVQICEQERDNLKRVFALFIAEQKAIAHAGKGKKEHGKESKIADINSIDWFDSKAVRAILAKLGVKEIREHDIDIMIWVALLLTQEVDENLDSRVDWKEFELMYKKCIEDQLGLEPRNLFNLVQFLMFCKPPEDEKGNPRGDHEFKIQIKAEDTYFLIYGRLDRQEEQKRKRLGDNKPVGNGEILKLLDEEIKLIFMDFDSKNEAIGGRIIDPEMQIDYLTYLRRVNKQALNKRQEGKEKRKVVKEAKEK